MEFLLLGPLEVRVDRERLALGGPRQRAVLADLLLHSGSVVSMDGLIDDLWGAEPPPTAEAVVQNAVSRLRKTLRRDVIETRAPGYVLRADPGAIDARRFERLVHDARPLPASERSTALRDALALWRGPPFADLAFESFLQDEIARLDELRLTALEDRLEAEVELRNHDAVIADAYALSAQQPARERLCRLLMLALHRAGRQQDALDAYEATRRALDELWGLEPSPETRALHLMILNQDPALAAVPDVQQTLGAVRRPVALLLVELMLDEELELEAASAALGQARSALTGVVARHGGSLSPELGVDLVAAFGAEGAREDDVLRAARTAVEFHEILRGREIGARLAVGTGRLLVDEGRPVLVGAVVSQTRRALHEAGAGEIHLTPAAARLGGEAFELDADGRLLGIRAGRPHSTISTSPLVARLAELASLHAAFDRAIETGRPQHAVLVGEAGMGKSRLVAAFVAEVPAVVLEAACVPYGEGISFLPLRRLHEHAAALDQRAPALGELTSADAALTAARALCEHFTAAGPLVVVLDDVHWATPTFLDLVEYVMRAVNGPLLVVSATRPDLLEQRVGWGERALTLEPLAGEDARCLLDALPEGEGLDEKVATSILQAAEGVPLFLEQLAAHAAESDLVLDRIPPTLDALLASRVDALAPGEREVLSRAAVVGRAFSRESIGALTPEAELTELDGRLASLARRRLLRPRGREHEFAHPLVRRAAYGAIGISERADMHARVGRWLDGRGETDELVGVHFQRAARDTAPGPARDALAREASTKLGKAGNRALLMFDYAAATNLLERATTLLEPGDPERLELECGLGHALKGSGDFQRAYEVLENVVDRARLAGERNLELRGRVELVYPLLLRGSLEMEEAIQQLDEAVVTFTNADDALGLARAEYSYSMALSDWGRSADSMTHMERADRAYRRLGVVGYLDLSAVVLAVRGTTPVSDALRLCEEARDRHRDGPRHQAYLRLHLAYLHALAADLADARQEAAIAGSELEKLGEEAGLGIAMTNVVGSIEAYAADWARARERFELGLDYTRERPDQRAWHAFFLARIGECALGLADPRTAERLATEAQSIAVPGDVETEIWWQRVAARASSANGQPRRALRLGKQSVNGADDTDDLVLRGEARLDLGEVLLGAGKVARAADCVHEGLELLDRKGAVLPARNGRSRFAALLAQVEGAGATTAAPTPLGPIA